MQKYLVLMGFALTLRCAYAQRDNKDNNSGGNVKQLAALRISGNGRYLITEDGRPFFWLGDTAWGLISGACREETREQPSVTRYFKSRSEKGFNVIQTVISDNGNKNFYGHEPFQQGDYTKPLVKKGPDNDYWDMVDFIVSQAAGYGFYLALLPVWNNSVPSDHPLEKDPANAYQYGHFLGNRYSNKKHIFWILGGDPGHAGMYVDTPSRLKMVQAMAEGIADGVNGKSGYDGKADFSTTLMSYHPKGWGTSSSEYLHQEPWLDFNLIQTGTRFDFTNYVAIDSDYAKTPPKPTLDSEVAYEYSMTLKANVHERERYKERRISDWDVRRAAYWSVFSGGFGFTYGHRSFVSWVQKGERLENGKDLPWYKALHSPASFQMVLLRDLMLSRPYLDRIPDQNLINRRSQGLGVEQVKATRDTAGTYAFVYLPVGNAVMIELSVLSAAKVKAHWFDPRVGVVHAIGEFDGKKNQLFVPPSNGTGQDWILLLDDASKNYPLPVEE